MSLDCEDIIIKGGGKRWAERVGNPSESVRGCAVGQWLSPYGRRRKRRTKKKRERGKKYNSNIFIYLRATAF